MRSGFALLLIALPALGIAQTRVISTQPDSVSITIYRDLFALITETRTVDLPADAVTLEFDGVVETLLPQSAVIAETGRTVDESNYDFERLTAASLLRKSIGKKVTLMRTNRVSGKTRQVEATLVSANDGGAIFETVDGNEALKCSGIPEKLTFEQIPAELKSKPALSIHLAPGTPGKRQVRVSYLAQGFGWAADYVAHLDAGSNRMNLQGWLTLRNFTDTRFESAQVQVMAGELNLLDAAERGTSTLGNSADFHDQGALAYARSEKLGELQEVTGEDSAPVDFLYGCYPFGPPRSSLRASMTIDVMTAQDIGNFSSEELAEIVVTGLRAPLAERENLADYQMYRVPWKTDLGARQTKQVAFLQKPDVTVERFYGIRIAADDGISDVEGAISQLEVRVGWKNTLANGLGEPLPGGVVRVFDRDGASSLFAGEDDIEDTPVGAPNELKIGLSPDVAVSINSPFDSPEPTLWSLVTRRAYMPLSLSITNAKSRPVLVEVRQGSMSYNKDVRVTGATARPARKAGDFAWRFTVPPNGERALSYKVGARIDSDD